MIRSAPIKGPWSIRDIVYVSVIGPVMIAAFLEWILWLAAFCYCLVKAFRKADHWSQRLLAILMILFFVTFRGIFLPVMIVTLPLPERMTVYFPAELVEILQWFAFYAFAILLTIPWLICVFQVVVTPVGRQRLSTRALNSRTAPKVVVVMPVYKEPPDSLLKALRSVVNSEYPLDCVHIFISFDNGEVDELYLKIVEHLGIPITLPEYPRSIDVAYEGTRVTISRFPHGGKRHCQKATYLLIENIYRRYIQRHDDLFILFIDSDCILDPFCIQNFIWDMELKPGSKHNMLAMTGVITSFTKKTTFITLLQDMEYIHGQLYERSVESGCGAVTCLPGALTILRFSAFRNMARFYFSDKAEHCEDLFDYGKTHLGEDRWLTHLFMLGAKKRYQIQMSTSAFCKTEAVTSFRALLKQRRRWFLGFITNEVCMLTDVRIWRQYPLLCLVRLMQNTIRTTALLFTILIISVATTANEAENLPWQFIFVSCGLNWLLMIYFACCLRRWKAVLYPMMFIANPFMNWMYMVYGIFTAGQRTWGGPRADAGAADARTTPQQAIEHAVSTGDDLNIIPETFRPALGIRKRRLRPSALQPSSSVEGRFVPAEQGPDGLFHTPSTQPSSSTSSIVFGGHQRMRDGSIDTIDVEKSAIPIPRRLHELGRERRGIRSEPFGGSPRCGGAQTSRNTEHIRRSIHSLDGTHSRTGSWQVDHPSPLGRTSPMNAMTIGNEPREATRRASDSQEYTVLPVQ